MPMAMFDIIIPVHNAEATLPRCLASLKAQTFGDFRAILVENGSTDASADLCRKVAQEDSRFCFLTLPSANGPSPARNAGLELAEGEYVAFVDSDDYVMPDYLSRLNAAFAQERADVVFFGRHSYTVDGRDLGTQIPTVGQSLTQLHAQDLFGYTWIKAFRREAIGTHRFCESLNLLEDEVFTCQVLATARRFSILPVALYCYITQNSASLAGRTHEDYCQKMDAAYAAWKPLLTEQERIAQADRRVRQCMYYGFERDLDIPQFFRNLAKTSFFCRCSLHDMFCEAVRKGDITALKRMRRAYRIKTTLGRWLKR